MSQFQSPFLPLTQSLVQFDANNVPAPTAAEHDAMFNPAMQLQTAHNLAMARRGRGGRGGTGQTATSQQAASGSSPIQKSVNAAKAAVLGAAGDLDDNAREQLGVLRDDPNVPLDKFEGALHTVRQGQPKKAAAKAPAQQHDFAGQPAPVADPNAGTMSITRGHGANAISPEAMHEASMRVKTGNMNGPVTNFADLTAGQGGWQATGLNGPAIQPPVDPVVQMVNSFKGHVPDEILNAAQHAINSGMTPTQAYGHLQTAAQQYTSGGQRQAHQQQIAQQQQQRQQVTQRTQFEKKHPEVAFDGPPSQFNTTDPNGGVHLDNDGFNVYQQDAQMKAREQQPKQQYQMGQTLTTPKGPVKVVGFDDDGHPLIQPLGN